MDKLSLKETIGAIRRELAASVAAAQDEDLRFELGDISLEFEVEVERSAEGSGGVKFWVVNLGAKGSQSSSVTHRVSLKLKPMLRHGEPVLTGLKKIPD